MSIPEQGKQFKDMSLIEKLRNNLQPQGTAPVVILRTNGVGIELNAEFVSKCIDELARMEILAAVGEEPSNLERLAFMLLCDSAYLDLKRCGTTR